MTLVMQGWEALEDQERLAWDVQDSTRRMKGINYFKQVNLRRLRRGEELAKLPPLSKPYDSRPLLKSLDIRNRGGRITLELELWRVPNAPRTVWGSLPSNLGLKQPHKCPRLGWLSATRGRWSEITKLYFKKHGEYIRQHGLQLVGKRIFIRIRPELDDAPSLYEQVKAEVPTPEVQMGKKAIIPSKALRIPFETPSKSLRSMARTTRAHRAPA